MDYNKLKADLAAAQAKIEELTAVAKYECSTWISSVPNNNGNLASPINLPMIGNDGNVVKQKNADGYDVVAGTEYKAWVQLILSKEVSLLSLLEKLRVMLSMKLNKKLR